MASLGSSIITVRVEAGEINRCIDAAIARLRAMQRKDDSAEPLPLVVVAAAAAAAAVGCARPVSRRSFFRLRLW